MAKDKNVKNVIDIEMDIESPLLKEAKKSPKAELQSGYSFPSTLEERLKYQALLSSFTVDQTELTPEFKFICELVSLEKNVDLAVISEAKVTQLMHFVFTTKWLNNQEIPDRKKNNRENKVTNTLIRKYVDARLVRLKQPTVILVTGAGEKKDDAKEEMNRKAFILNSALRDDFCKWVIDTNSNEQLSLMGGSISSSSTWLSSLPTRITNCINFHYAYKVEKKKRDKSNGLMGINIINFVPEMDGVQDPAYVFFSGDAFTPS